MWAQLCDGWCILAVVAMIMSEKPHFWQPAYLSIYQMKITTDNYNFFKGKDYQTIFMD